MVTLVHYYCKSKTVIGSHRPILCFLVCVNKNKMVCNSQYIQFMTNHTMCSESITFQLRHLSLAWRNPWAPSRARSRWRVSAGGCWGCVLAAGGAGWRRWRVWAGPGCPRFRTPWRRWLMAFSRSLAYPPNLCGKTSSRNTGKHSNSKAWYIIHVQYMTLYSISFHLCRKS